MIIQAHDKISADIATNPEARRIFNHQRPAFEKLLAVAKACFAIDRRKLVLRPRTNSLIVAPSGSGKTHLVREVARELGMPLLAVSISEWILLGGNAGGGTHTWPLIAKFLLKSKEGCVIFIDEIDKINGGTSYDSHLRNEVYRLLDLRVPEGLTLNEACQLDGTKRLKAEEILQNHCIILAAGAFQHLWDKTARASVGFGGGEADPTQPDLNHLALTLPRELVNRFRSDLVVLPTLMESDYHRLLEQAREALPEYLCSTFVRLGLKGIPDAIRYRKGVRFVEELFLDSIIEERRLLNIDEVSKGDAVERKPIRVIKGLDHGGD